MLSKLMRGLMTTPACLAVLAVAGTGQAHAAPEVTGAVVEAQGRADADPVRYDVPPAELELMRACGLSGIYAPIVWIQPRMVSGDFDGDDALDYATFVERLSDGARGVAICRAGTWLDIFGFDGPVPGSSMDETYFSMVEAWRVSTMDEVAAGWTNEAPRPQARGDVLVLERIEKALYSLYWDGEAFRNHQHYRYVEP